MQQAVPKQWINRFDAVDLDTQLKNELAKLEMEETTVTKLAISFLKAIEALFSKWFGR